MRIINVLLIYLLIGSIIFSEEKSKLKVYYFDRIPFYNTENNEVDGILIKISKLVFEEAGIEYEFVNMPVKRMFEILKSPGNTCILGALMTKEREELYLYSNDYFFQDGPMNVVINKVLRSELPSFPTIKEILESNLRMGVIDGYSYGEWLDNNIVKYKINPNKINISDDSERMYKMIISNRFDYMFAGFEESLYAVKQNNEYSYNLQIVNIKDAPMGNKRYFLFSKGIDKNMLNKINNALEKVKLSNNYKEIISNIKSGTY